MPVKKTAERKAKKVLETKKPVRRTQSSKTSGLSVPVYALSGQEDGQIDLPIEIFGGKVNNQLIAQAVRIYGNNQKGHWSNTKTRGQVQGSTRKIFKQKGTGRARHGAITAPIFVGGGIALGPVARKVELTLPKKMKKAAVISALSMKMQKGQVAAVKDLTDIKGKTRVLASFLQKINGDQKKMASVLFITEENQAGVGRAVRNIPGVSVARIIDLNAYQVVKHQRLILNEAVIGKMVEVLKVTKGPKELKVEKEAAA